VKRIVARVGDFSIKMLCNPVEQKLKPVTHVDAQFSLPWAIATAICKNKGGIDEFGTEALKDAEVLAMAEKVAWEFDPDAEAMYPKAYPATLIAELNDGRSLQAHIDFPKGDPENPATKMEIISKFHSLTERYLNKKKREKIIETVNHLEEVDNIVELANMIR
jgi:2-methylcitrate dehydratase PrpD